eukprot:2764066-Karenia_brevis.AAC.2
MWLKALDHMVMWCLEYPRHLIQSELGMADNKTSDRWAARLNDVCKYTVGKVIHFPASALDVVTLKKRPAARQTPKKGPAGKKKPAAAQKRPAPKKRPAGANSGLVSKKKPAAAQKRPAGSFASVKKRPAKAKSTLPAARTRKLNIQVD